MWLPIVHWLDRAAIRSACGSVRPSPDGDHHAPEAMALLDRPDFFKPDRASVDLTFSGSAFQFHSPVSSGYACNDIVSGRLIKARSADWRKCPSVIIIHGWNAELQYEWMVPRWSRRLARAGLNAISFELPYHSSRRPRGPGEIRNYLSGNLRHVMAATHQTLAEVRALAGWLQDQGSPTVSVWGVSLGAWLAGLALSHQPELSAGVLLTPVARMERALKELAFCEPIRDQVSAFEQEFVRLNLVSHRPRCSPGNVLVVAPSHDLFAPVETMDELERAWHPEMWRLPHGHISVLLSPGTMRRITKWLATHPR